MATKLGVGVRVSSLNGRRQGRIVAVASPGVFVVKWTDGPRITKSEHDEDSLLSRYTVQSAEFGPVV